MSHYIADVGVFGHTMGASTDWGTETHHSDYESWFDGRISDHTVPSTLAPVSKDAYKHTLQLAKAYLRRGCHQVQRLDGYELRLVGLDRVLASAIGSLNLAIQAVASAIDHLVSRGRGYTA